MSQSNQARIFSLNDLPHDAGGGKAIGLARLIRLGLRVPPAIVIIDAEPDSLPDGIEETWSALGGGEAAVRSSGSNEDGEDASSAGQYETLLNVRPGGLNEAVRQCLLSARSERLDSYEADMHNAGENRMSVVVQRMVQPLRAGVLFTADPLTGNRDVMVVESVAGLGEVLVSGHAQTAARYTINTAILNTAKRPEGDAGESVELVREASGDVDMAGLDYGALEVLRAGAALAGADWGVPLDLEWAIDSESGEVTWLQSRPITALADSLDSPISDDTLITRCNIGEMMSGAATPLTLSTVGTSLNTGLALYYRSFGALRRRDPNPMFVVQFEDQLFMNLSTLYIMSRRVAGATQEGTELAILGYVLPEHDRGIQASFAVQLINGVRYFGGLFRWKSKLKAIEKLAATYKLDCKSLDAAGILGQIAVDHHRVLDHAFALHYAASAFSGAMNAALTMVLSGGSDISDEANRLLTQLLANVDDVESAAVLKGLEELASLIRGSDDVPRILSGPAEEVHKLLMSHSLSNKPATEAYRALIARHGHRCIREIELREPEWAMNPNHLIESLRALILTPKREQSQERGVMEEALGSLPKGVNRRAVQWITKQARIGVRVREKSKSMLVKIIHQFKMASRRLGEALVSEGFLPEADLCYFLTLEELGRLVDGEPDGLVSRARRRRRRLAERMELRFPDLSWGKPTPQAPPVPEGGTMLSGIPVSRGVSEGVVRVVSCRADAEALTTGEIMVAQFTDIGWTPFYGRVAGMITEIGGALSHGSVVAREYGLPLVGGLGGACTALKTGMRVRLDGGRGTVTILDLEPEATPEKTIVR